MKPSKSFRRSVVIAATSVVVGGLGAGYLVVGPMASADTAQVSDSGTSDEPSATDAGTEGGRVAHLQSVLAPLVADGTITQAQADKVIAAIDAAPRPPRHGGMHKRGKISLESAAAAIGMTVEELRDELRSGKSIAQVAAARGVDTQKVIDALVAAATKRIDEAVAGGRLTAEQASTLKADLEQRITDRVNRVRPEGSRPGRHHGGRPGDEAEPTPSTPTDGDPRAADPGAESDY